MERRGKGFFITAIVFAVIATIVFIFFLTANIQLINSFTADNNVEAESAAEAIAGAFATGLGMGLMLVVFVGLWVIVSAVVGIFSIVFSSIAIKYTKWSIAILVLSVLYVAAPFIFLMILGGTNGSEEPAVQSAMCGYMSFIC